MKRRPTSILTTLAVSVLALTLIAPWALGQDPDTITEIRRQAEQGDAEAQFHLGFLYANGEGVLKDDAEAVRWYRLAAEQGNAWAQLSLGAMYAAGRGVLRDSVLAHMWSNIAGANGNEYARELRDILESYMTRAEISRATELARACMASDYQDCEPADLEGGSADPGLAVREAETAASGSSSLYFTRGSHQDDVLRIQGTPSSINRLSDHEVWWYGVSTIDISLRDGRVREWSNISGNLKVRLDAGPNVTDAQTFTRGSHQDDVLRIQGTPSSINRLSDHEVWWYGVSTVDISLRDGRVREWSNISGNLKVRLDAGPNVTDAQTFTRGSHQDDVLRIQGTPSSINRLSDHEVWWYGVSTIDISLRDGRVREWNNISGNLKVRLDAEPNVTDAQTFTLGSQGEGVFQIGEITDPPTILFKVDPQYSEEARKAQYQGTVVLEAIVRSDGTLEILRVVRSLDFGLDENAIQALKQWKFRPGMRNGQPVDVVLNIEVNFNLR